MAQVAGIQIEKDDMGNNTFVRINLKKYGDIINPILFQLGVIEESFEQQCAKGITVDEARKEMHNYIAHLYQKNESYHQS